MDVVVKLPATATTVTVTVAAAAPPSSSAVRLLVFVACCCLFSGVLDCSWPRTCSASTWEAACMVLQVAATRVAMLLPSRRRRLRHGVAFVALAAASLGNCLLATVVGRILTDDPGYRFYRTCCTAFIAVLAVGDILNLMALLLRGEN